MTTLPSDPVQTLSLHLPTVLSAPANILLSRPASLTYRFRSCCVTTSPSGPAPSHSLRLASTHGAERSC